MTDIDKDKVVAQSTAAARNWRVRWSLFAVVVLGLALIGVGVHDYSEQVGEEQDQNAVLEDDKALLESDAEDVNDGLLPACRAASPRALIWRNGTCPEAFDLQRTVDDPENQEPEQQNPEDQNPENDDADPNDADPDDPETQNDEEQNAEIDDPETQDEEFDDPENQEPEIQEPENQEPENQEPEINDPQDPAQTQTYHDFPTEGQTTTCQLRPGSDPNRPEYDCSTSTPPGESSLLSWWGTLAYLSLGRRAPGVIT